MRLGVVTVASGRITILREGTVPEEDYCNCDVDPSDEEALKAHHRQCGKKPPSVARPVNHSKTAASDIDVPRCHVCSISDAELAAINSDKLVKAKGAADRHACPAHSDCYFDPANFWNEGAGEGHRVVARDQHTGEIIDPNAREVVRSDYYEKVREPAGE